MPLLPGICMSGWPSEKNILPVPAAKNRLLQSHFAGGISTLNVLDLYLKLSSGGTGAVRGFPWALCPAGVAQCGRMGRTALCCARCRVSPAVVRGSPQGAHVALSCHGGCHTGRASTVMSLAGSRGGFCCCFPCERYLGFGARSDCARPMLTGWLGQGKLQMFPIKLRFGNGSSAFRSRVASWRVQN